MGRNGRFRKLTVGAARPINSTLFSSNFRLKLTLIEGKEWGKLRDLLNFDMIKDRFSGIVATFAFSKPLAE